MKKIKGPAIFLAQFMRDEEPFNTISSITKWAADLGYKGIQIPSWDPRAFDLEKAAESKDYCDEYRGITDLFKTGTSDLTGLGSERKDHLCAGREYLYCRCSASMASGRTEDH